MSSTRPFRSDYGAAVFPDRHRVAGVELKQLTLGHALLLKRLDSPFGAEEEVELKHEQTLLAVYVCSMDWRVASRRVNGKRVRWWLKWMLAKRIDCEREDNGAALRYFRSAWRCPQTFKGDGCRSGGVRGAENVHILIAHQRSAFRKTIDEAMDTPVAMSILDRLEAMEEVGTIRIWSSVHDAQAETIEKLKSGEIPIPKPEPMGARRV